MKMKNVVTYKDVWNVIVVMVLLSGSVYMYDYLYPEKVKDVENIEKIEKVKDVEDVKVPKYCWCVEEGETNTFMTPEDYCDDKRNYVDCIIPIIHEPVVKVIETKCVKQVCVPFELINYSISSEAKKVCKDCESVELIELGINGGISGINAEFMFENELLYADINNTVINGTNSDSDPFIDVNSTHGLIMDTEL